MQGGAKVQEAQSIYNELGDRYSWTVCYLDTIDTCSVVKTYATSILHCTKNMLSLYSCRRKDTRRHKAADDSMLFAMLEEI